MFVNPIVLACCPFAIGACRAELVQAEHYCKNHFELARGGSVDTADKCAQVVAANTLCGSKYFYWGKHLGGHCKCATDECVDRVKLVNAKDPYSIYSIENCGMQMFICVLSGNNS